MIPSREFSTDTGTLNKRGRCKSMDLEDPVGARLLLWGEGDDAGKYTII